MAVAIVGEKEVGSITNLISHAGHADRVSARKTTPLRCDWLDQFSYSYSVGSVSFRVPLKGGFLPLAFGAVLYVFATTALGLFMSSFAKTQIAAIFGTAIATTMPATQFSGMMTPVSSLTGGAALMGKLFPTTYFLKISVGTFTKALGFVDLSSRLSRARRVHSRAHFAQSDFSQEAGDLT